MARSRHPGRCQGLLARAWLRVAPLVALAVVAAVVAMVWSMQDAVDRRQQALDRLVQIEATSGQQGSMALGALVRGSVSAPEALIIGSLGDEVQRQLDRAGRDHGSQPLAQANQANRQGDAALMQSLRLLGERHPGAARALVSRVAIPRFIRVHERLGEHRGLELAAIEHARARARHRGAMAGLGGLLVVASMLASWVALRRRMDAGAWRRASERRLHAVVDSSSDMITVLGADGRVRIQTGASSALLGLPPEELMGAGFGEHVHPDDAHTLRRLR